MSKPFMDTKIETKPNPTSYPMPKNVETLHMGDAQYDFFLTDDGSPTIRRTDPTQPAEAMHHCGGALTESLYIYGRAVTYAQEHNFPMRVLSVGLGLGYNELIAAALADKDLHILSFEKDSFLREGFLNWLSDNQPTETTSTPLARAHTQVLELVAKATRIDAESLKAKLYKMYGEKKFLLCDDALDFVPAEAPYSVILFDAFSKKSTPDLWSEEFLIKFLEHYTRGANQPLPPCIFSTYACTGNGKRALKSSGFEILDRPGFHGKRQSTLAVRI